MNDTDRILDDMVCKHAINMCICQIGEHAARIRRFSPELYENPQLKLFQIKGMRDRITYSYGT